MIDFTNKQFLVLLFELREIVNINQKHLAKLLGFGLINFLKMFRLRQGGLKLREPYVFVNKESVKIVDLIGNFLPEFQLILKKIEQLIFKGFNCDNLLLKRLKGFSQQFLGLQNRESGIFDLGYFILTCFYLPLHCGQSGIQILLFTSILLLDNLPFLAKNPPILFLRSHHRLLQLFVVKLQHRNILFLLLVLELN